MAQVAGFRVSRDQHPRGYVVARNLPSVPGVEPEGAPMPYVVVLIDSKRHLHPEHSDSPGCVCARGHAIGCVSNTGGNSRGRAHMVLTAEGLLSEA